MNHGQFYKADALVAAVHRDAGGIFAGFRAAHAYGRIYAGTFVATPVAKTLSRAAHFQGTRVPVTTRLSGASGDPTKEPSNVVAMATKFYLPDGTVTDLIGITLPAFFARTPEEFRRAHCRSSDRRARCRQAEGIRGGAPEWRPISPVDAEATSRGELRASQLPPASCLSLRECRRRWPLGAVSLGTGSWRRLPAGRGAGETAARLPVRRVRTTPAPWTRRVSVRTGTRPGRGPGR